MAQTSASNERQIREAKAQARRDAEVEKDILVALMSRPNGRRWMWNQLAFCNMWSVDRVTDPGQMAFDKGLRNYGLKLFNAVLLHTPEDYITMTRENSKTLAELTKEATDAPGSDDPDDTDS